MQVGAAVPDKQPNNPAATIPTPKHAPAGAGKAPATSPAAGSSQVNHIVLQLLLCDALHRGECTAEVVRYLIPVLLLMCWT